MSEQKDVYEVVTEAIKNAGLLPIPVQTMDQDVDSFHYYGGDVEGFFEAAKALGAKAIFVEELYLEEDEFYYDGEIEEDECACCCQNYDDEFIDEDDETEEEEDAEEVDDDSNIWLEPEDLDGVDLSLIDPEIVKFDEYVGDVCGVLLTVPGADHLQIEIFTDWYKEFAVKVDDAIALIEDDTKAALDKINESIKEMKDSAEE